MEMNTEETLIHDIWVREAHSKAENKFIEKWAVEFSVL